MKRLIGFNGQMDVTVRYSDSIKEKVSTRYLSSAFMEHATAEDVNSAFYLALGGLSIDEFLQISMDGPNVDWKFLECFSEKQSADCQKILLCLGSCELHVIHGALQTGQNFAKWNVSNF